MRSLFSLSLQTGSNYHDLGAEQEGELTAVQEEGGVKHVEGKTVGSVLLRLTRIASESTWAGFVELHQKELQTEREGGEEGNCYIYSL